jgi:hypothetical protein
MPAFTFLREVLHGLRKDATDEEKDSSWMMVTQYVLFVTLWAWAAWAFWPRNGRLSDVLIMIGLFGAATFFFSLFYWLIVWFFVVRFIPRPKWIPRVLATLVTVTLMCLALKGYAMVVQHGGDSGPDSCYYPAPGAEICP